MMHLTKHLTLKHSTLALALAATTLLAACGGSDDKAPKTQYKENMAPTAAATSFTTQADTAYTGKVTATDPDMDALTYAVSTAPTKGTLTLSANGNFSYVPNSEFTGSDTFSFTASDHTHTSAVANVTITIDMQQVSFSEYSRKAFNQVAIAKPLPLNGRNITQDVTAANAYDDLLAK